MNENINCDRITKKIIFTKLSHTWTIFFVKQNSGGCFHINTYVSSSLLILYGIKDEAVVAIQNLTNLAQAVQSGQN